MKLLITQLFYNLYTALILYADSKVELTERVIISSKLLFIFAPIAYMLNQFDHWFSNNHQFVSYMIYAIIANMGMGVWAHLRRNTFDWKSFWMKNIEMFILTIIVYFLLEMLNQTAGRSITGQGFQIFIQSLTLLFPISKTMKSIHIVSNGKHPPRIIMKKLYRFDETGDLNEFFKTPKKDEKPNENENS